MIVVSAEAIHHAIREHKTDELFYAIKCNSCAVDMNNISSLYFLNQCSVYFTNVNLRNVLIFIYLKC